MKKCSIQNLLSLLILWWHVGYTCVSMRGIVIGGLHFSTIAFYFSIIEFYHCILFYHHQC